MVCCLEVEYSQPPPCLCPGICLDDHLSPRGEEWWSRRLEKEPGPLCFDDFVCALQAWLREENVHGWDGAGIVTCKQGNRFGKGTRRPFERPLCWKRHVLNKMRAHAREMEGLKAREGLSQVQVERVRTLVSRMKRLPWRQVGIQEPSQEWGRHTWRAYVEEIDSALQHVCSEMRVRQASWRARIQEAARKLSREATSWVREEWVGLNAVMTEEGPTADAAKVVQSIASAWKPIFQGSEGERDDHDTGTTSAFRVPELQGEDLRKAFRGKHKGAAGADKVSVRMAKGFPLGVWNWLASFFCQVERHGRWPLQMRWVRKWPPYLKWRLMGFPSRGHSDWWPSSAF